MTEQLSQEQVIQTIWDLVTEHKTQKAVAELLGITPTHLSDILNNNRTVSDKVAKKIGFIRKIVYEPQSPER